MKKIIVDGHMHLGRDPAIFCPGGGFEKLLASMESLGISRCYSSHYYWLTGRIEEGYRASVEGYEKSCGSIPFLGVYDPRRPIHSLRFFDRCLKHPGFIGIKIHPSIHRVFGDDKSYLPVWAYAKDNKLPILSHTWSITANPVQKFSYPPLFAGYIDRFVDVAFVMGHSGGRGKGQEEAVAMAKKYPNVYLDIAGDIFCSGLIARLVESPGAEKIIFGSDWPWFDPMCYLPRISLAPLSGRDKSLILGINALRIFEPGLLKKWEEDEGGTYARK
jgi:uncharacterized protein